MPSTPDAARVAPEATASIDIEVPEAAPAAAAPASDQADAREITEIETYAEAEMGAPSEAFPPEASSPAIEAVAALGTPLSPESADAALDGNIADASITVQAHVASANGAVSDAPAVAVSVPLAEIADIRRGTATDQIAEMLTGLPPRPITSDKSEAATNQVATVLVAEPPAPPPPPTSDATEAATLKVAEALAATPPAPPPAPPVRPIESTDAKPAPVAVAKPVTPPPPLPKRKPDVPVQIATARPEPQAAATAKPEPAKPAVAKQEAAKPDAAKQAVAPQETTQPRSSGPWLAMALAPADKPVLKVPTARPSGAAYASKIWAALARHKPRAGVRGSATVVFSIGENGGLRGVKVGRSSGNTRIDQLALQTVRSAAPYPPPPSGLVSYTIRIDFQ
ncbi:MAG: TonB family protein [Methyloceanibacter sp.]